MIRLLFPYMILILIVLIYLYFRQSKLGNVILKINRVLISRYSTDSLFLIAILTAVSYFLVRYELSNLPPVEDGVIQNPIAYVIFYAVLIIVVIAREVERPAIREKGISTSRGFWRWDEIESFRWSKHVLMITVARGKRKRIESWQVVPNAKKEVEQHLKKLIPKKSSRAKKKI